MPEKYEAILLDADGTLFDYDRAESFALEQAFAHFGLSYDGERHLAEYRSINDHLWLEFEQGRISLAALRTERFRRLFGNAHGLDLGLFSATYLDYLACASYLLEQADEVCRYLSRKYVLAILSNGIKEVQAKRLSLSPLSRYIKYLIVSEDAGFQKPDPRIFSYAFEAIGIEHKHSAIIVGDSLSSDIQGGHNYGIHTCWYNPSGRVSSGIKPTYEIRHLNELMRLL